MQINFHETLEFFVLAVGAIAVCYPLLVFNNRVAPKLGLIDWPKARGITEHQIPIIGPSIVLASILYFSVAKIFFPISGWFLSTGVVMAIMGMLDDRKSLPALDKMFVQTVFVVCLVLFDPGLRNGISTQFGPAGTFLSIFFILGLMNSVNFIDGIDGLAGLVLLFGALGFYTVAPRGGALDGFIIYAPILVGSLLAFLYLNVLKRKGFLGNVGSYFFSYVLAYIHLSVPIEAHDSLSRLSISGLFFLVPISDAAMVLLSRLITRRSPFQADKGHLHHRLIQSSLPLRYILVTFAIVEAAGLITGYALVYSGVMRKSVFPIITLLTNVCVVGYMIVFVEKSTKRRVQSFFEHLDSGYPLYFLKYKITQEDGSPVPRYLLHRVAARINSEIRVTDVCYIEEPNILFVALKLRTEPLTKIAIRLEAVFHSEKVRMTLELEKGEFAKIKNPGLSYQLKRVKSS